MNVVPDGCELTTLWIDCPGAMKTPSGIPGAGFGDVVELGGMVVEGSGAVVAGAGGLVVELLDELVD